MTFIEDRGDTVRASMSLNINRRQLTREQRRALVAESIKADPQLSDREHGRRVGVDHKTAAKVRDGLAESGEIPHFSERITADGRGAPGAKPKPRSIGGTGRHLYGSMARSPGTIRPGMPPTR